MATKVQKWGNSLAIRLPKALADQANLQEGSPVEIEASGGVIKIRAYQRDRKRPTLAELLDQYKPHHRHGELDKSGPVGRELI